MLFYIDDTIFSYAEKSEFSEEQMMLWTGLALAQWSGKCILTGDHKSVEHLSQCLGTPVNGIYLSIHNAHAMQGALLDAIPRVFVLTADENASMETIPDSIKNKSVFLNLTDAVQWNLSNGSSLVGENMDDCKFYKLLGEKMRVKREIKGTHINFSCEPGGGSSTSVMYKECVEKKKVPTLCIVDSDQKYGKYGSCKNTPSRGGTFQAVKKVDKELSECSQLVPHEFLPLDVHEVENLIPSMVLKELQSELPAMKDGLEILERLKVISDGDPILYYDFKNGIRYKESTDHCKYWTEIADALGEQFLPIPEDQLTPKQRDGKEQLPASPPFFPILHNRLLECAQNWMEINTVELDDLDEYLRDHWKQIGLTVLAWGCAMQPLRA